MFRWGKMQSSKAIQCIHGDIHKLLDQKMLILNVNGVLCYFPQCVVLQGNTQVFNINIDLMKMEVRVGMEHFFSTTFEKNNVALWSCMKLEDVLKVLPMLMLEKFLDQFVFIWGAMNNVPRFLA
jgi:hypothetical protein